MNPKYRFFTIIFAISLVLAACGQAKSSEVPATQAVAADQDTEPSSVSEDEVEAKVLRIRLAYDMQSIDPAFWSGTEENLMLSVYEGLVSYKPGTWEVVNTLAESITPSDDGLTIDFKLKEGIQFHGGYGEVTAEDVKFSFERIAGLTEPALDSAYAGDWGALDHVEVTGTYTGQIILKEPFAALWTTTLPYMSGVILSQKAVTELGDEFATHPIGTGPYELTEWKQKERYVLKRFADYGGANLEYVEPVEWDEIDLIFIGEENAASVALDAGDLDVAEIATGDIDRYSSSDKFDVVSRDAIDYWFIGMNVQNPKLQDVRVRQAIQLAVDVPSILEATFDGRWARACSLIAPGQIGYWSDAPCYDRDVEAAKALLAEAGISDLELAYWTGEAEREKVIAEVVQANLADIGITVDIVIQDDATRWDAPFGEQALTNLELFQVDYITSPDPSWSTVWFTCDQVTEWNWLEWCNEDYDKLHFDALQVFDQTEREAMYIEMQQLWDEAHHTIWLAYPTHYWAARKDIEMSMMPHARLLIWDFRSK